MSDAILTGLLTGIFVSQLMIQVRLAQIVELLEKGGRK